MREIEREAQIAVARVEPGFAHARVGDALVGPTPDDAGERGDDILRQSERLPDLADRAAGAVADHGRGDAGAVAAVFVVDVLDDLLAPLMLEIDIDVGRLAARGADKALEQHVDLRRIDRGDAEAIADDRVGRRAAALAQDVLAARELDNVVHGEEIAREIELLDQLELVFDALADVIGDAVLWDRGRPGRICGRDARGPISTDRKSTRLNSSHLVISYAVFCLKKKKICSGSSNHLPPC